MNACVTRLAPSPTGALHLGNARTFLVNWLLARQNGWRIVLRIEDLDGPRVRRGADQAAIDDLHWLGLDWNEGPIYQSTRADAYAAALQKLADAKLAYPCTCSRKEVESAASAPHAEDGAVIYPSTCRGKYGSLAQAHAEVGRAPAVRFRLPDGDRAIIEWNDGFRGTQRVDAARQLGDFVVAKADGTAAYQLAVVVDDAAAGVTDVVRGDDLVDSTPRQALLYRALKLSGELPRYYHLPLVVGPDGRRLAKRHGDTRLSAYRRDGVPPERLLRLLARWCAVEDWESVSKPTDLLSSFRLGRMSREPITFGAADDAWLRGQAIGDAL